MRAPLGAVLAAGLLLLAQCAWAQVVVKIGHAAPTSGSMASIARENENGARMAVDELNARDLVIGGKHVRFTLVAVDDGTSQASAIQAARSLVEARVNGVVGHFTSGATLPASRIYAEAGIPEISPSATNPLYTSQGFGTTFRIISSGTQLGAAVSRYAARNFHPRRVVIIDDSTAYGQQMGKSFMDGLRQGSQDAEIVAIEHTTSQAADFPVLSSRVRLASPDLIFFGGMDKVAGPLLRQIREMGIDAKFAGADGICSPIVLPSLAGDALGDDKVLCVAGGMLDARNPALADWEASFRARFGAEGQVYGPHSYDAVMVLAAAMQLADSTEPATYLPFLMQVKYSGVSGDVEFDQRGDNVAAPVGIYTYRQGQRVLLGYTPAGSP
jgi:branched-chain amino acid transport system substrate-binding protein